MTQTQRGDKTPTTDSTDMEPSDEHKDWERVARRRIGRNLRQFYTDEVAVSADRVRTGIEDGGDPVGDYWTLVSRVREFTDLVGDELVATGHLRNEDPRLELLSVADSVESRLLTLGRAVQADSVGEGLGGDEFEAARAALQQAEALVDDLEAEHRDDDEEDNDG